MRGTLVALSIYAALAAIQGRDVLSHAAERIPHDAIDPVLNASVLAWNARHVPLSNAWWDFPGFHPTGATLTFSEHLLGLSAVATPLWWVTDNPIAVYNVLFALTFVLSAAAAYALAYQLTGDVRAAFLAGLVFGFAPYRAAHLAHIQVLTSYWMPVALLALHRYLEAPRVRWLGLFAAAWLMQGLANNYYLLYFSLFIALWVAWFVIAPRRWRMLLHIGVATAAAAIVVAPIVFKYLGVHDALNLGRDLGQMQQYSSDVAALLTAPPQLSLWGWLAVFPRPEGELFPGLTLPVVIAAGAVAATIGHQPAPMIGSPRVRRTRGFLLVAAGVCALVAASLLVFGPWRLDLPLLRVSVTEIHKPVSLALLFLIVAWCLGPRLRAWIRSDATLAFYAIAAGVMWVLSLGPRPTLMGQEILYQPPYSWLLSLPGFDGVRAPARFWMIALVCLSVVASILVARLLNRVSRRHVVITALVAAGLVADGWMTVPPVPAPVRRAPLEASAPGANVLELPLGSLADDAAAQYRAVLGGWKTFNGYSGYRPAHYHALDRAVTLQDDDLFAVLRSYGAVIVAVPAGPDAEMLRSFVERQPGAHRIGGDHDTLLFRLEGGPSLPNVDPGVAAPIRSVAASCGQDAAPHMFDGDLSSRWECGAQAADRELTVELGAAVPIRSFSHLLGPFHADFPAFLHVDTSLDGTAWEPAWRGATAVGALRGALADPLRAPITIPLPGKATRFVRLRQTGRDPEFWSVAELTLNR